MSEVTEALSLVEWPEKLGRFAQRFETLDEVWAHCPRADWMFWMLETFGRGSKRALRMFICLCARRWWLFLTDPRSKRAVELAERYAAGDATQTAVEWIRDGALQAEKDAMESTKPMTAKAARLAALALDPNVLGAAIEASAVARQASHGVNETESEDKELMVLAEHAAMLRELMPNPFARVTA